MTLRTSLSVASVYTCGECGTSISPSDLMKRACGHNTSAICADMEAVATGDSAFLG